MAVVVIVGIIVGALVVKSLSPRKVIRTVSGPNIHVEELSFYDGLEKIYGRIYKPQDTLGRKPVLICCSGLATPCESWDELCQAVAKKGIVAYAFDARGGLKEGHSSGNYLDMTVTSVRKDLEKVLKNIRSEEFTDKDHVYLIGHSQGALVAAMVGSGYRKEVAGMVLLAPAFNLPDVSIEMYPRKRDIPDSTFFAGICYLGRDWFLDAAGLKPYKWLDRYDKDVLIIHGRNDELVPISYSEKAAATFKNAELVAMPGTGHAFTGSSGSSMRRQVIAWLEKELSKDGTL